MKRGMLKPNAAAVARRRVGNNSGSHAGIHENSPWQKNAFAAATGRIKAGSSVHRNSAGVMGNAAAKKASVVGLRPNRAAVEAQAVCPTSAPKLKTAAPTVTHC